MKKKIVLIPTDFSIESLVLLKKAISMNKSNQLEVILLYCSYLSDSISDLLFYSPDTILAPLISEDFKQACAVIENKYSSKILEIRIEVFHGRNQTSFKNFIEANKVFEAYIPKKYTLKLYKNAFDSLPFIKASKLHIQEIDWQENKNIPEKDKLAELFLN